MKRKLSDNYSKIGIDYKSLQDSVNLGCILKNVTSLMIDLFNDELDKIIKKISDLDSGSVKDSTQLNFMNVLDGHLRPIYDKLKELIFSTNSTNYRYIENTPELNELMVIIMTTYIYGLYMFKQGLCKELDRMRKKYIKMVNSLKFNLINRSLFYVSKNCRINFLSKLNSEIMNLNKNENFFFKIFNAYTYDFNNRYNNKKIFNTGINNLELIFKDIKTLKKYHNYRNSKSLFDINFDTCSDILKQDIGYFIFKDLYLENDEDKNLNSSLLNFLSADLKDIEDCKSLKKAKGVSFNEDLNEINYYNKNNYYLYNQDTKTGLGDVQDEDKNSENNENMNMDVNNDNENDNESNNESNNESEEKFESGGNEYEDEYDNTKIEDLISNIKLKIASLHSEDLSNIEIRRKVKGLIFSNLNKLIKEIGNHYRDSLKNNYTKIEMDDANLYDEIYKNLSSEEENIIMLNFNRDIQTINMLSFSKIFDELLKKMQFVFHVVDYFLQEYDTIMKRIVLFYQIEESINLQSLATIKLDTEIFCLNFWPIVDEANNFFITYQNLDGIIRNVKENYKQIQNFLISQNNKYYIKMLNIQFLPIEYYIFSIKRSGQNPEKLCKTTVENLLETFYLVVDFIKLYVVKLLSIDLATNEKNYTIEHDDKLIENFLNYPDLPLNVKTSALYKQEDFIHGIYNFAKNNTQQYTLNNIFLYFIEPILLLSCDCIIFEYFKYAVQKNCNLLEYFIPKYLLYTIIFLGVSSTTYNDTNPELIFHLNNEYYNFIVDNLDVIKSVCRTFFSINLINDTHIQLVKIINRTENNDIMFKVKEDFFLEIADKEFEKDLLDYIEIAIDEKIINTSHYNKFKSTLNLQNNTLFDKLFLLYLINFDARCNLCDFREIKVEDLLIYCSKYVLDNKVSKITLNIYPTDVTTYDTIIVPDMYTVYPIFR